MSEFTVVIGSCARGTADLGSDLDVVRIGHFREVRREDVAEAASTAGPVTCIDYDVPTFRKLYATGSLFLYHIFTEGVLIRGDGKAWRYLQNRFSVQHCFAEEIQENLAVYYWLNSPDQFENAEYPLLSYLFRVLKNISIFSMAQRNTYIFEKRDALHTFMPNLPKIDVEKLITANRIYEREIDELEAPVECLEQEPLRRLFLRVDRNLNQGIKIWSP